MIILFAVGVRSPDRSHDLSRHHVQPHDLTTIECVCVCSPPAWRYPRNVDPRQRIDVCARPSCGSLTWSGSIDRGRHQTARRGSHPPTCRPSAAWASHRACSSVRARHDQVCQVEAAKRRTVNTRRKHNDRTVGSGDASSAYGIPPCTVRILVPLCQLSNAAVPSALRVAVAEPLCPVLQANARRRR